MKDVNVMLEDLKRYVAGFESVAVAFSGGVDSSVLDQLFERQPRYLALDGVEA